jgi:O-antigen ligase/tetratricopeptide (TPR) repeat protein
MPYKSLFYVVVSILVTVPLVFWHGVFFPFTFVKTIVFYLAMQVAFLLWMVCALTDVQCRPRVTPIGIAILLFIGILGVAVFTGIDPSKSLWSNSERMFGFITWLHLGIFFLVVSQVVRKEYNWQRILSVVISTATVIALYAVWQGLTTSALSISTIGNAAYLSSYLVPSVFLTGLVLLREQRFTMRVLLYGAVLVLLFLAIIFTEARAGIVGLAGGLGVSAVLFLLLADSHKYTFSVRNRVLKKFVGIGVALAVIGIVGLVVFPDIFASFIPSQFQGSFDFDFRERTASGRLLVWQVAWEGWKERFFLGWGPENFNIVFNRYYHPELHAQEPWFDRAHNFIVGIGTSSGIAGLLAYSGMFAAAAFMAVRRWKKQTLPFWSMIMIVSLLVAHLTQNLFTFDTLSSSLLVFLVFGYVAADTGMLSRNIPVRPYAWAGVFMSIIMVSVGGYYIAIKPFLANAAAHKGWELLRTGGGDEAAIAQFEKSISYGTQYSIDTRRFTAEYVFEFLKQGGQRPDASLRRLTEYAIVKMNENIEIEPHNVKWIMYRGELYSLLAQKIDASFAVDAEKDFLRARDMSSNRAQIYLELALSRKLQGDTTGAWKYLDHVIDTTPQYMLGHWNAVVLAIETGSVDREEKELAILMDYGNIDSEGLRDTYFKVGRYQDAVAIQELIISLANQNEISRMDYALLHAQLAALYQFAGELDKARKTAVEVARLDPSRRNEVEAFLQTLE